MFYDVLNDLRCFSNVSLVVGPVNAGGLSDMTFGKLGLRPNTN